MANHAGSEGAVYVGANQVAEITGYSIESSMEPIEDTLLGDAWKTYLAGNQSWSASCEGFWDETDTTGQGALTLGSSITANFYLEGNTSTDTYLTGTALVTGVSKGASVNGMVTVSFSLQGTGALSESVVV
ncbi:MAG: phage tail protein [Rhodospirillaceae bacterium]|nr:phage tail protein [Rhodospirillaceae bacterium]